MKLEEAILEADVPVLLMLLVQLTGDERWIHEPYLPERTGRLFAEESGGLPQEVQAEVREAALKVLQAPPVELPTIDDRTVLKMMAAFVGEEVPAEYLPLVLEDVGIRPAPALSREARPDGVHVVIVGAGVSGICAAVLLEQLNYSYSILEKNDDVGGTWLENTYPEAGVDTPNHFYSYSFAAQREWTSYFSKAPEILAYLQDCVVKFGITDKITFGAEVENAVYDETAGRWNISYRAAASGVLAQTSAEVLLTAVGQVNRPKLPAVPGIDSFQGEMFHTARWPADLSLENKRVVLVGTGASAVQIARTVARECSHLTILQRSPQWIMPNPDYHRKVSDAKRLLLRDVPFYAAWYRFGLFWRYADGVHSSLQVDPEWTKPEESVNAINHRHRGFLTRYMTTQLADRPDLLDKALPNYPPYGKRMVIDNDWFATLKRPNVALAAAGLAEVRSNGVVTTDGDLVEADVIVMATGFQATRMLWPMDIVGRDGVSIHDAWKEDDPTTYLGITTPGFPNMFMLLGPTTSLAHGGSVIFQVEAQVRYVMQCLLAMEQAGADVIECRQDAADDYTARADAAHSKLVFSHHGMSNWYKNRAGRVVTVSPWRLVDYWHMTREVALDDFDLSRVGVEHVHGA